MIKYILVFLVFSPTIVYAYPDYETKLLIHCEGPHSSTSFTDSSQFAKTIYLGGTNTPSVTTVNFKYGTGSALLNFGHLRASSSSDFSTIGTDTTIELWAYLNTVITSAKPLIGRVLISGQLDWNFRVQANGSLAMLGSSTVLASSAGIISPFVWYHLAVVKQGDTTTIYKDGVSVAVGSTAVWNEANNNPLDIGAYAANTAQPNGFLITDTYLDEIRFTKGVARYTSNFTPPSNGYVNPLDIRFYYTGAGTPSWPNSSLGGTVSSSEVAEFTHNIFDWVTSAEAATGDTEYRAIDIKNDSITDNIQAVTVWLATQGTFSTISYGYDGTATQSVSNESTAPTGITFGTGTTKATGVVVGNMPAATKKRLWLKRVIPAGSNQGLDSVNLRVGGMAP